MSSEMEPKLPPTPETSGTYLQELANERLDALADSPEASADHQETRAAAAREAIGHHENEP